MCSTQNGNTLSIAQIVATEKTPRKYTPLFYALLLKQTYTKLIYQRIATTGGLVKSGKLQPNIYFKGFLSGVNYQKHCCVFGRRCWLNVKHLAACASI